MEIYKSKCKEILGESEHKDCGVIMKGVTNVVPDSLQPQTIQSVEFSRPEYWSG